MTTEPVDGLSRPPSMPASGEVAPSDGDRALVFLHIPKTAGLTLRRVMVRQHRPVAVYSARVVDEPDGHVMRFLRGEAPRPDPQPDMNDNALARLGTLSADQVARLRLFLGHFWFGVHERIPHPATYVTMLRDPIDRILSLYQHRVDRHRSPWSLEEYVERRADVELDNHQTRRLAGSDTDERARPCTETMLATAQRNAESWFRLVGLTERFDESLLLMAREFGWNDVRYQRDNVSTGRPRREDLPRHVLETLEEWNRFDHELLAWARSRFDERVRATPGLAADLARFRRRNAAYQRRGGREPLPVAVARRARTIVTRGRRP